MSHFKSQTYLELKQPPNEGLFLALIFNELHC